MSLRVALPPNYPQHHLGQSHHRSPFCRDTSPRPGSWIKSMGGTWDSNKPSERVTLSRHQTYDETNPFDILCRQLEKRVTLSATYFLKKIICPDLA